MLTNPLPRDDVAKDLLQILAETKAELKKDPGIGITDTLMQKLCRFVATRDDKVFRHGFNVGKNAALDEQTEKNKEG